MTDTDKGFAAPNGKAGEANPLSVAVPGYAAGAGSRTGVEGLEGSPLDPRYTFDSFVVGEENRRPGGRDHPGGADLLDIAAGPVHSALPLLLTEIRFRPGRNVVDHRIPDRAGELQEVAVVRSEPLQQRNVTGTSVVLVEHPRAAVAEHQRVRLDDPAVRALVDLRLGAVPVA